MLRGSVGDLVRDGYPLMLDPLGDAIGPAWSVKPGDVVGFALNGRRRASGTLAVKDGRGVTIATLERGRLFRQTLRGTEPWRTGAGYVVTHRWRIPEDLPSAVYFLEGRSELFVVVREPSRVRSPVAVLISTNTFNAYSRTASASLYAHPRQVPEVSFMRPFDKVKDREWRAMIDWLAQERPFAAGVRYLTDFDLEQRDALEGVKVLIVLGHSEYWSRTAREVFDAHVEAGRHVVIAGGNVMKWQVRYGNGGKTLISYKGNALEPVDQGGDPVSELRLKTGRWYDAQLGHPTVESIGGDFIRGGYGAGRHKLARGWNGLRIVDGSHPLLEGLGLRDCDLIDLGRVTEYDGVPIRGLDERGRPVADHSAAGMARLELLAYDWGYRGGHTIGTAHVLQKRNGHGIIVHLGAKECAGARTSRDPRPGGGTLVHGIVRNAVSRLLDDREVFSRQVERKVAYPGTTPWKGELPSGITGRCAPPRSTPSAGHD